MHVDADTINHQFLGNRLKRNVFNKDGLLVIPEGTELGQGQMRLLELHHIELSAEDVLLGHPLLGGHDYEFRKDIDDVVKELEVYFENMRYMKRMPLMDIRQKAVPLILEVTEKPNMLGLIAALQSRQECVYRHSLAVGILSALIGRWLGMDETQLSQLALGGVLHDIGLMKLPAELLSHPEQLDEEQQALLKKHTVFGYELLKETTGASPKMALMALQHHEREDGSGYPLGIKTGRIDRFGQIAAAADAFHRLFAKRSSDSDASSFNELMAQFRSYAFGPLDPLIVHLLLGRMLHTLPGSEVLLSDGSKGRVVLLSPWDSFRPLVQVQAAFRDLSKDRSTFIERVFA